MTCKIDLKDAYFLVPINKSPKTYLLCFALVGNLYEFLHLCFDPEPTLIFIKIFNFYKTSKGAIGPPLTFTKLTKVSTNYITSLTKHPSDNFPGRYSNNGSHAKGVNLSSAHSNLLSGKLRICFEF